MVMTFLPNEADATYPDQAEPDSVDFEILLAGIKLTGVVSGCAVTESGTPAQTIDVAAGVVRVAGRQVTVDVDADVAVSAADGTNPRIDLITSNLSGVIVVTAGTPAAEPVLPDIPATSVPLATLYVPANDNTHGDAQINDKRIGIAAATVFNVKHYGAMGDESTDDTTAIAAAFGSVSGNGQTVYFPTGVYLTNELTISDQRGMTIRGEGLLNTEIRYDDGQAGTVTDFLRFVNCATLTVEDIQIGCRSGNTVTNLIQVTCDSGAKDSEHTFLRNVFAQGGGGTTTNGFAIGTDTVFDVAETVLVRCIAWGFDNAGFIFGNGTTGNVLDISAYGCESSLNGIGVKMQSVPIKWYGGTALQNTIADFQMTGVNTAPTVIDGVRSEGSKRFWDAPLGDWSSYPVSLSNIVVSTFTDVGGVAINHVSAMPLFLSSVMVSGGAAATVFAISGGTSEHPGSCTAINITTDSAQPFTLDPAIGYDAYRLTVINHKIDNVGAIEPSDTGNTHPSNYREHGFSASIALDARVAAYQVIDLTGDNTTTTLANGHSGQRITIAYRQNATGGHAYSWPTNCIFAGATPTLSIPLTVVAVTFVKDGSNWMEIGRGSNPGIATEEAGAVALDSADSIINMESTGGTRAVTLPDNADYAGKSYLIRRDGGNDVTVTRAGSDTFDDAATVKTLASDGAAIGIFSIGDGEWKIVGIQGTVT